MDSAVIYGVLTAATAVSSGFAGARAVNLNKKIGENTAVNDTGNPPSHAEIQHMQQSVTAAISERSAGAQNASAWLATSTALFGVASTRSISDAIGISFLVIGAGLVVVAVQAVLKATEATSLLTAHASFERWYLPWIHARALEGARPTDEEIAFAYARENKTCANTLKRFEVWPFHFMPRTEAVHLSRR